MGGGGESSDCLRPLRLDWEKSSWSGGKKAPLSKPLYTIFHGDSVCVWEVGVWGSTATLTWIVLDRPLTAIPSSLRCTFRNKQSRAPQAGNSSHLS